MLQQLLEVALLKLLKRLENTVCRFKLGLAELREYRTPEIRQQLLHLLRERLALLGQPKAVGAQVAAVTLAHDQLLRLELIDKPNQRGTFNADLTSDIDLPNAVAQASNAYKRSGRRFRNTMSGKNPSGGLPPSPSAQENIRGDCLLKLWLGWHWAQ